MSRPCDPPRTVPVANDAPDARVHGPLVLVVTRFQESVAQGGRVEAQVQRMVEFDQRAELGLRPGRFHARQKRCLARSLAVCLEPFAEASIVCFVVSAFRARLTL